MQKIFEKIIEKLQKEGDIANDKIMEQDNEKDMAYYDGYDDACEKAVEIVKQAAAKYNNGWIPCNGVLYPDDMEDVLINMGGLKAIPAYRQNGKWYLTDCRGSSTEVQDQSRVIAWQPLPESYQKGE